ncbi:nucleotidyltransferase family protein [uncultured Maribacter sp.]|uniref:nucleotidyltransferase family protein n=1 Tax=uncultured Maribacter sp. TaxID=431308 RepID=UPI00263223DF|nr:nucleotidyltransferase family protein [uncultured Maribacter sp.]
MSLEPSTAIIILAAGASTRMKNKIKQLLPWKESTFLGNTVKVAKESLGKEILVVLGAYADKVSLECIKQDVNYIINPNWKNGLGSSIASGVKQIKALENNFQNILILLADQPYISTEYINAMIKGSINSKIVATRYAQGFGVPALFNDKYYTTLEILNKDFGAKKLLEQEKQEVKKCECTLNTLDIDTFESYLQLVAQKIQE